MNDQQKLSRGKFMGLVGGMALTAVLFKLSSVKNVVMATSVRLITEQIHLVG
jgi:hypothetical protein